MENNLDYGEMLGLTDMIQLSCINNESCILKEKFLNENVIEETTETILSKMRFDSNLIDIHQKSIENYLCIIENIKEYIEILNEKNRSNFKILRKLDNGDK